MPDLRRSLAALALLALPACADDEVPDDLGTWPEDQVKVADSPALAHLAAAIDGGDALSVADLFHPDRLTFKTAPDPSALYAAQATDYAALPALAGAEPLRVLTYNVGLLSRWYPFTHVGVPHYLERRERSPIQLLGDDWDILFLEEAWELVDVDRFAAEAEARGYAIYSGTPKKHEQHGLIILVREALIGDAAQEFAEVQFDAQREIEYFPGPGVKRGYLGWSFTHAPTGRRIHLYGTHFTSFPELFQERDVQARTLGGAAKDHPDDDIVLIGGDFNAGAYYPEDRFGLDGDEVITGWWHNTMMYPLILHYGGVVDTHSLLEPAHDVERMHQLLLPFDGDAYLKQPLAGRCADIPTDTFTGTDCNSIYDEQYAATEFPARLDYIFLRDVGKHVRVTESALVYTAPFDFGGAGKFELSDHYGMSAILQIER
jgi:endonuclease/exonuclease/phosphatase family metal-dependent hydrolase